MGMGGGVQVAFCAVVRCVLSRIVGVGYFNHQHQSVFAVECPLCLWVPLMWRHGQSGQTERSACICVVVLVRVMLGQKLTPFLPPPPLRPIYYCLILCCAREGKLLAEVTVLGVSLAGCSAKTVCLKATRSKGLVESQALQAFGGRSASEPRQHTPAAWHL